MWSGQIGEHQVGHLQIDVPTRPKILGRVNGVAWIGRADEGEVVVDEGWLNTGYAWCGKRKKALGVAWTSVSKQSGQGWGGDQPHRSSTHDNSMTDDHRPFNITYSTSCLPATFLGSFYSPRNSEQIKYLYVHKMLRSYEKGCVQSFSAFQRKV